MNSEQRALADELDQLAAGCTVYSPDQCATMIDGIGWISMRHKLRKAAELLRAPAQPASAAGVEDKYLALQFRIAAAQWNNDEVLAEELSGEAEVIWKQYGNLCENVWQDGCRWLHSCVNKWPEAAAPKPEDAS